MLAAGLCLTGVSRLPPKCMWQGAGWLLRLGASPSLAWNFCLLLSWSQQIILLIIEWIFADSCSKPSIPFGSFTPFWLVQYRSKVSWQSLASRKTWLKTQLSILKKTIWESGLKFHNLQVGFFKFQVKKNNELAGWLSFIDANWIREVLLCDVEGNVSRLSSCCLMKIAFNLSLLPERSTINLSRYCNSQNRSS